MDAPQSAPPDDTAYLSGLVREHDRPRYYAALFAPQSCRDDLFAIYGFAAEIARIPDQVAETALGEMRLAWWREALERALSGAERGDSPAVRALAAAMQQHALPATAAYALIEARSADLYSDPPATLSDVEGRLGETESALFQFAALAAGANGPETADAAGHAGVAYGTARRLSRFAVDRARGRTILPADLLAAEGLMAADLFEANPPAQLHQVVRATAEFAHQHLRLARGHVAALPENLKRVFLPLAVVEPLLKRVTARGPRIVEAPVDLGDLRMLLSIGWARLGRLPP